MGKLRDDLTEYKFKPKEARASEAGKRGGRPPVDGGAVRVSVVLSAEQLEAVAQWEAGLKGKRGKGPRTRSALLRHLLDEWIKAGMP